MAGIGFVDVEKLERFYLNSCTDLPSSQSRHQSFPVVARAVESEGEDSSTAGRRARPGSGSHTRSRNKSRSSRRSRSSARATEVQQSNSRVKQAFLKVYGSLMSFGGGLTGVNNAPNPNNNAGKEHLPSETTTPNNTSGSDSDSLAPNCTMSKEEFIEKFNSLVSEISLGLPETFSVPSTNTTSRVYKAESVVAPLKNKVPSIPTTSLPTTDSNNNTLIKEVPNNGTKKAGVLKDMAKPKPGQVKNQTTKAKGTTSPQPIGKFVIIGMFTMLLLGIVASTSGETVDTKITKSRYFH